MRKTVATFCLIGATFSLSACNFATKGDVDTAPPYSIERTAKYSSETSGSVATPTRVAPAEKVFRRAQNK